MKEIEWAELRIDDGDGGDYLNIYSDDKTYSYLLEDVFERMNGTDLARITAENVALRNANYELKTNNAMLKEAVAFYAKRYHDEHHQSDTYLNCTAETCTTAAALKDSL